MWPDGTGEECPYSWAKIIHVNIATVTKEEPGINDLYDLGTKRKQ